MSQVALVVRPRSCEVREFAIREGLAQPGQGRLSREAIDAFNATRRGIHRYVKDQPVRRHSVKPEKGRTVSRNFDPAAAREWALANGYTSPGARGRLSREALDAYILSLV